MALGAAVRAGAGAASWDTASAILSAVPGADTHATVPLLTGTYLTKFRDSSGLYSAGTAYATAVQSSTNWTTLASLIEDSAFTGTKRSPDGDAVVDTRDAATGVGHVLVVVESQLPPVHGRAVRLDGRYRDAGRRTRDQG